LRDTQLFADRSFDVDADHAQARGGALEIAFGMLAPLEEDHRIHPHTVRRELGRKRERTFQHEQKGDRRVEKRSQLLRRTECGFRRPGSVHRHEDPTYRRPLEQAVAKLVLRFPHEHRHRGPARDAIGDAAEPEARESAASVRGHDDEIGSALLDRAQDAVDRRVEFDLAANPHAGAAREPADHLVDVGRVALVLPADGQRDRNRQTGPVDRDVGHDGNEVNPRAGSARDVHRLR
jgi:hypothetical protein